MNDDDWYGPSLNHPPPTPPRHGYAVIELPRDPNEVIRLLLRVGNVPFPTIEDARTYMRALYPDPRYMFAICAIEQIEGTEQ